MVFEDYLKGDKVILYRLQGGQKYLVADRYRKVKKYGITHASSNTNRRV